MRPTTLYEKLNGFRLFRSQYLADEFLQYFEKLQKTIMGIYTSAMKYTFFCKTNTFLYNNSAYNP